MMFNLNNIKFSSSPFEWFVLDNAINKEAFTEIQDEVKTIFDNISKIDSASFEDAALYDTSFPAGRANVIGGGSTFDRHAAKMVLNETKNGGALEKLCNEFLDVNLQKSLYRLLIPVSFFDLSSLRPVKIHPEEHKMTILDYIFYKNCYVNLKLSSYTSNFGLMQHKDHGKKVTALLFYLGFTDSIKRNDCGIQLYDVTDGNKKWSLKESPQTLEHYDDVKLKLAREVQSYPNRLFGFRKTRHSWHGVKPSQFPLDVRREALQINLMKHYNASRNLSKILVVVNGIKNLIRPFVKRILGFK